MYKSNSYLNNENQVNGGIPEDIDFICFSHLRWDFVFQRPQHLFTRISETNRVFYIEEPIFENIEQGYLNVLTKGNIFIITPYLPQSNSYRKNNSYLNSLLKDFFVVHNINQYLFWYYTPMALNYSRDFNPKVVIYDCMDELSKFIGAPKGLLKNEKKLFASADVVFTGGRSLYEHKKKKHRNIFCFPSSIDVQHFEKAKSITNEPSDQRHILSPKIGFFGVIDERLNISLLDEISKAKPEWNWIIIGPVVKIDPAVLPRRENIHYLGPKKYDELPAYLSGWDASMILFAKNDATKFISPTKTPEYLAAGKAVVSTSIKDVVYPYNKLELVYIADDPEEFVNSVEKALKQKDDPARQKKAEAFLATNSWNKTWDKMRSIILEAYVNKQLMNYQVDTNEL